ncbi:ion channel [Sphingomonas sp. RB56-2]|uniref:Ion channel n=1 Tax=Sphingomonas brevis TaxID=2908206 RepID=A0ABT0SA70_9SPHN|nr:ion channel [Sphingomonas brevis]MCL6741301.1 ion channel [Sphingomonas brevis]
MPNASKSQRWIFLAAILALVVLRFVAERDDVPINFGPILALYGLTGLIAAAGTLRFVVQSRQVDSETIFAALSTYLLAGLFFGVIYSAIEFMAPGSFTGPDPFDEATAVYYSFVTLATLGYGDFLPRTELARGVATFEVIGGQLYLAVMVARLIGAFGNKPRNG